MLLPGDKAPDFTLPDANGNDVRLSSLRGQKVILYFYPKDDTPGCTQEACDFTQLRNNIKKKNAVVLGISRDAPRAHAKFIKKYELRVPLLSDQDGKVVKAYGAWGEKDRFGKKYEGIVRTTFLINEEGEITNVWENVKVDGHSMEVYEYL